eukprot:975079_1
MLASLIAAVTFFICHVFITQSVDNTSVVTNWTSIPLNALTLQRSKAIYSKTLSDDGIGLWVFGGLLEDNIISSSVMYLNLETDDITSYDGFMGQSSSILPIGIWEVVIQNLTLSTLRSNPLQTTRNQL